MREILFRGQTRRKGEKVRMDGTPVDSNWVYGGICPNNTGGDFAVIYQQEPEVEKFPVYSDTVGQYIGLSDKNSQRIFEGDIIKLGERLYQIVYGTSIGAYRAIRIDEVSAIELEVTYNVMKYSEIIGNIFDNPELLTED